MSGGMGAEAVTDSPVTGWRKPSSSAWRAWRSMMGLGVP